MRCGSPPIPCHIHTLEFTFKHLRPLRDRLIVQRLDDDSTQHAGTIVIPDSAKEKPLRGTVLAAGLGKSNEAGARMPLDVKAGEPMRWIAANAGHEASIVVQRVKGMNGDEGFNALTERYEDLVAAGVNRSREGGPLRPAECCVSGRPAADHRGCHLAYAGEGRHNLSRERAAGRLVALS